MAVERKMSVTEIQAAPGSEAGPTTTTLELATKRSLTEILRESRIFSYWQEEWKPLAVIVGSVLALLLHSGRECSIRQRGYAKHSIS